MLELYQTEWCPASRRVRQRLTELGLDFVAHQVPVDPAERTALRETTGLTSVPVLAAADRFLAGGEAILAYLDSHYDDPPGAADHRAKAAKARRRDLEEACPQLQAATR